MRRRLAESLHGACCWLPADCTSPPHGGLISRLGGRRHTRHSGVGPGLVDQRPAEALGTREARRKLRRLRRGVVVLNPRRSRLALPTRVKCAVSRRQQGFSCSLPVADFSCTASPQGRGRRTASGGTGCLLPCWPLAAPPAQLILQPARACLHPGLQGMRAQPASRAGMGELPAEHRASRWAGHLALNWRPARRSPLVITSATAASSSSHADDAR